MSRIQKAAAAAMALAITLAGATLAVAPLAFADTPQGVSHLHQWSGAPAHRLTSATTATGSMMENQHPER